MTTVISSTRTSATHVLHVRHGLTGGAVPSLRATLVPPTPWWYAARLTSAGDVAVVTSDRYPDGAAPVVRLSVTDPEVAASLTAPLVEVTLGQPEQTHTFASGDHTVTAVLARGGRTDITLAFSGGASLALDEVPGERGTYRCAPTAWTTARLEFDLEAGGAVVGRYRLDPFARDTRLHAVIR